MTHWQNFYHDATAEELDAFLNRARKTWEQDIFYELQKLRLSLESSMDDMLGR